MEVISYKETKDQHISNVGFPFSTELEIATSFSCSVATFPSIHISISFAGDFSKYYSRSQLLISLPQSYGRRWCTNAIRAAITDSLGAGGGMAYPFFPQYYPPSKSRDGLFAPKSSRKLQANSSIVYWIFYAIFAFVGFATSSGIGKLGLSRAFVETKTMLDEEEEKKSQVNV